MSKAQRATFGFSVHTGWAAMIAVTGPPTAPIILERARLTMIEGTTREAPRFVYHVASELPLPAAERLVREATEESLAKATAALKTAIAGLTKKQIEVVATGIVVTGRPLTAALADVLKSHSLIHSAEGQLFRTAIKSASERLKIPVVEVRAKDLSANGARVLGVPPARIEERLAAIGRAAGRPWAKDQKDSFLAALLAANLP